MLGQCIEELAAALLSIAFDMPSVCLVCILD
jgi:hypothetical protein